MKKILLGALMVVLCGISQAQTAPTYRESGDTIFVGGKMLLPGDTVYLGFGSDPYKNFLFVMNAPTKQNPSVNRLSYVYSNSFLVYKGTEKKKMYNQKLDYKVFYINGIDNIASHCIIAIPNAIAAKEIIRY